MDNMEELDKFLETYNIQRLNHEESDHLNRPITSKEIESVVKSLPWNTSPGSHGFTCEFYLTFKEELILVLLKRMLPNSFNKASITLKPKPDKDTARNKITGQYPWWT